MMLSRLIAAFLVAPAIPALIFTAPPLLFGTPLSSAWSMFVFVSIVTYAHAIVLGLPTAWLLSRRSPLTLFRVVGAAFAIGALPFCALVLSQEFTMPLGAGYESNGEVLRIDGRLTSAGIKNRISGVLVAGIIGGATGLVWWLIARSKTRGPIT